MSVVVKVLEEVIAYCCDVAHVQTAFWQTCEGASVVESIEERTSHCSEPAVELKASLREVC